MSSEIEQLQKKTNELTSKAPEESITTIQQCLDSAKRMEILLAEQRRKKEEWDARQQFWTKLNNKYKNETDIAIAHVDTQRRNPEILNTDFKDALLGIRLEDRMCLGVGNPPCTQRTCTYIRDECDNCAGPLCIKNCAVKKVFCSRTSAYYDDVERQAINDINKIWNDKKFWCEDKN